jgi:molecular chaperone HscB
VTTTSQPTEPTERCWSCAGPVAHDALFCTTCRAVLPPRALDHFRRLGIPRSYALDHEELDRRYFALQRQLHPDRFATHSARERAISQSQAVSLNEAYETLGDPLRRAEYLLTLAGSGVDGEHTLRDPQLLAEQMERRENLMEATTPAAVAACVGAASADIAAIEADLTAAFARSDVALARRFTLRLRYLAKLVDEGRARHRRVSGTAA